MASPAHTCARLLTALEDLAGNKVGRPFDVDTFDRITVRSGRGVVRLSVMPKP